MRLPVLGQFYETSRSSERFLEDLHGSYIHNISRRFLGRF